jgi:hypothetical protein
LLSLRIPVSQAVWLEGNLYLSPPE